jgi:hypothetical protein
VTKIASCLLHGVMATNSPSVWQCCILSSSCVQPNFVTVYGAEGSSVSTVTRLRAGRPGFDILEGRDLFLFATVFKSAGLRAGDRDFRVRFPAGAGNFSLHHRVQNGSGAHPASYPMGTRGSLLGGKAARA